MEAKKRTDLRHFIAIGITLIFLGFGALFYNSVPRLAESVRDFIISVGYYFAGLIYGEENPICETVNTMPEWSFGPSRFEPLRLFPWTWDEFKVLWSEYWQTFVSDENFGEYWRCLADAAFYLSRILVFLLPLYLGFVIAMQRYVEKHNNNYDVDSKQLKRYKKFVFSTVYPIISLIRSFIDFLKEHSKYLKIWLIIWLLYFNIITVIVEFLAFYLYFVISFDFLSLYTQVKKLFIDLTPLIRFVPLLVWIIAGILIFNYACRKFALMKLYRYERRNRGFLNERGVVTIVYGSMGAGKTSLITSMGLSAETQFRDDAFVILLETDIMFPSFPWASLREEVKRQVERRAIVDIPSCKRFVKRFREYDEYITSDTELYKWWRRNQKKRSIPYKDFVFGYDREHYATEYNDNLKITDLWEAIETYVCAYFVYMVETSLIISNYAVRTDAIMLDLGNFPLWNSDFFRRDPRLMDAYSRHSHIIDFDMLRLGKRMVEENPNRNAFGFGIYIISEIDKERKNALELKETKINTEKCNQKNDLFNACLKMSRHACVIANRVFIKIICDLQRPEDWGAGGREVGEVVYIAKKGDTVPTLPFYSPFWYTELIFLRIKAKFDAFYVRYIHNRGDNTLLVHLSKGIVSLMDRHYRRLNNLFGAQVLRLEVESGRMNGDVKKRKWYKMPKKDYSKRYSTNCLSAVFEGDEHNTVSISEFIEYADILATSDELSMQHSHFQTDIRRMKTQSRKENDVNFDN